MRASISGDYVKSQEAGQGEVLNRNSHTKKPKFRGISGKRKGIFSIIQVSTKD
jgi:hypothetical protein